MDLVNSIKRSVKRFIRGLIGKKVERKGQEYITKKTLQQDTKSSISSNKETTKTVATPYGKQQVDNNPLASTREQFVQMWPAMPKEVKKQMLEQKNILGRLPKEVKENIMKIQRQPGEDPTPTDEEKKILGEAFDLLNS